jgi:hypothetical protein
MASHDSVLYRERASGVQEAARVADARSADGTRRRQLGVAFDERRKVLAYRAEYTRLPSLPSKRSFIAASSGSDVIDV